MASTRLSKTFSGNGDRQKFTLSMWIKRTSTSQNFIFTSGSYSSTSMNQWFFDNSGIIGMYTYNSSGSVLSNVETTRKFLDTNAWYHFVWRVDTTQSTASDRLRLYVNGVQETTMASTTYPSQNANYLYSESITAQYFGQRADQGNGSSFDGSMTHIHMCDGYSYDASSFGETDSTSGIWKPKTNPSVTYGTNGYFLKMENSGAMGTDSSGNSNTFTVSGTITQNVDSPSNSFCLFNRLDRWLGTTNNYGDYLSKGNNTVAMASANKGLVRGTLGVEAGKWYWEAQANSVSKGFYGMTNDLAFNTSSAPHDSTLKAGIYYYEGVPDFRYYSGAGEITTDAVSISADDILMFALDMDNKAFYIGKNGTWMASGDPTSGSSKTGAISEKFSNPTVWADSGPVFPAVYVSSTSGTIDTDYNFGNGNFGTTAVASANADGNGIGKFEYSVPSGYYAICTKNIKEFG